VNVAVVSCVFPPEPVVSSRTSWDIASALHSAGHGVTVICPFPSRPEGKIYPGFRRRWRARSTSAGVEVVRCFSTTSPRSSLASRFAENVSFGLSSMTALLRVARPDVLFLNSWPIFATGLAALAARLRRVPYVLSVQDVYPESLIVQKRAAARVLAAVLRWIDSRIARNAAAVIVLSESFARIYRDQRRVDPARVHVIPNWSADRVPASREEALAYRRVRGIADDDFLVVYGGNIGVAAGVEHLLAAFRSVERPNVRLLIAGGGARADACERLAAELGEGRVVFHRPWLDEETAVVLAAADLLALPTAGEQSQISVPSKLISYLLAERPVLAVVREDSETADVVRQSGAGWIVEPGRETLLASAITAAADAGHRERRAMGARGRLHALSHFGLDQGVRRVLDILRNSAG
jgi:colanic acid biosynthesis glycosyl transferase WcaI